MLPTPFIKHRTTRTFTPERRERRLVLPTPVHRASELVARAGRTQFDIIGTRILRDRLLEIGDKLAFDGLLSEAEEIFYLSPDEVHEATTSTPGTDWRSLIAARKAQSLRVISRH